MLRRQRQPEDSEGERGSGGLPGKGRASCGPLTKAPAAAAIIPNRTARPRREAQSWLLPTPVLQARHDSSRSRCLNPGLPGLSQISVTGEERGWDTLDKGQSRGTGPGGGNKGVDSQPALLRAGMAHSVVKMRLAR